MININPLSPSAYVNARFDLLAKVEGNEHELYLDSKRIPTIGIGFNMRVHLHVIADAILGTHLTSELEGKLSSVIGRPATTSSGVQKQLDSILNDWSRTRDVDIPTHFAFSSDQQVKQVLNEIASSYERAVVGKVPGLARSEERAVLFSLQYNADTLIGPNIRGDISNDERAEAWYEIRYRSNLDKVQANRRYVEANRFGLYDDESKVEFKDATKAGQMYTTHRFEILTYEMKYSPLVAKQVKDEAGIGLISDELRPAIDYVKAVMGLEKSKVFEELLVATNKISNLNGDGTKFDSDKNDQDLMVGSASTNRIVGGKGDDALFGLDGSDSLYGQDGDDYLDGGTGTDKMDGGAGSDYYVVDNTGDTITDSSGERDVVSVAAGGSFDFKKVEEVQIGSKSQAERLTVTLKANEIKKISYNDAGSTVTFATSETKAGNVDLQFGAGADTFILTTASSDDTTGSYVSGTLQGYLWGFQCGNIGSNDKIDLTDLKIDRVITQSGDVNGPGRFLMGPNVNLYDRADNYNYWTNDVWAVVDVRDKPDSFSPLFTGSLTANNFEI